MDVYDSPAEFDALLEIGAFETGIFGNRILGSDDEDGLLSFAFDHSGGDLSFYVEGYDIDRHEEIEVFLNDRSVGFMSEGKNRSIVDSKWLFTDEMLLEGENIITFEHKYSPNWTWGVSKLLLLGEGPHVAPMDVDPEFAERGFVVWQTETDFILGKLDLDTGAFLGVINTAGFVPTDFSETKQGPEIVINEYGIGAIGRTDEGLVYFNSFESYLLPDTEGYYMLFTPKGQMEGLRFTMQSDQVFADEQEIYLYDNGVISQLDLDGGIASSWFNSSEFIVSHNLTTGQDYIGTYDVDTGVATMITDATYGSPGHHAAFTDSNGVQWAAFQAGEGHMIWRNDGTGWERTDRIKSPLAEGSYFYSPEFFYWNGEMHLSGYVGGSKAFGDAAVALYRFSDQSWAALTQPDKIVDPEIVILSGDRIAFFYTELTAPQEWFDVVSAQQVNDLMVADQGYWRVDSISNIGVAMEGSIAPEIDKLGDGIELVRSTSDRSEWTPRGWIMRDIDPFSIEDRALGDTFEFIDVKTRVDASDRSTTP